MSHLPGQSESVSQHATGNATTHALLARSQTSHLLHWSSEVQQPARLAHTLLTRSQTWHLPGQSKFEAQQPGIGVLTHVPSGRQVSWVHLTPSSQSSSFVHLGPQSQYSSVPSENCPTGADVFPVARGGRPNGVRSSQI